MKGSYENFLTKKQEIKRKIPTCVCININSELERTLNVMIPTIARNIIKNSDNVAAPENISGVATRL